MTDYVLGIDMGTGGARVGIFDLKGTPIAFAEQPYPLYTPASGRAEQKPEEWWDAICIASHKALEMSGVKPGWIRGISVDTTCCTVLVADENMNPLRPAIMWMDVRASAQAKAIAACGHEALAYNGWGMVSAECLPAKALWLKQNEPETYHRAKYLFECTDWLMYRLTGELTASIDCAAPRWYYNSLKGGYPKEFYELIGLEDLLEKLPKRVLMLGDLAGGLTAAAAQELGLVPGIPVGEGGADAFVGMIGLNAISPGKMALITGSSHLHLALVEKEVHQKGMWGSYPDAVIPGLQMIEGGQTSTGSIVNWFKNQLCGTVKVEADKRGCSVYDILNEEAAKLPVGAEGLIALDFFQGNRTPHVDPDVRGMFYGLSLKHTPAHIYRAIIEGICFGTQRIIESFGAADFRPSGIVVSGGAAKSDFWLQCHADVSNAPLIVPTCTEGPVLGSAILGAVAAGLFPDIQTAANEMTSVRYTLQPNAEKHAEYQFYYQKYCEFYDLAKNWMHDVTNHATK